MYQEFIAEADAKGHKFKVKAFIGDAEDFGSLKRNGYFFLGADGKEIITYAKRSEIAYVVASPKVDVDDIGYDFNNFGIISGGKA